ncbi:MAG TPA: MlaD family protein [Thermoleophilaceae bacterium]|jgi:virulence factor Mce-like protein
MIKQAPSPARIAAMIAFAMSCVGLLLFLWLSFGGAIPLRPQPYEVKVAFPEATGLLRNLDVRSAGITIGKVADVDVEHASSRSLATLSLDPEYAPLANDSRATLRTKTLLGETFVELTLGSRDAPTLFDGGRLPDGQVEGTVELDEVFQTYDPITRKAIQSWQQELGTAIGRRGEDLSNSLGQLPEFSDSATDLLDVLYRQERSVRGLFRDTGEVYAALTRDERQLSNLISNSHALFSQTASQREALAETFHVFPTFLDESRTTLLRLEDFSRNARPLVRDLRPVARELRPTLRSLRSLAPDLLTYFDGFDRQIDASKRALPAQAEILDETLPLFRSLGPFLQELNPILEWLEVNQHLTADFLGNGAGGTADTVPGIGPNEVGHYLRQLGPTGAESIGIHQTRLSTNRGNAYMPPIIGNYDTARWRIYPNWDCIPATGQPGGAIEGSPGPPSRPPCFVRPNPPYHGQTGRLLHVNRADYGR